MMTNTKISKEQFIKQVKENLKRAKLQTILFDENVQPCDCETGTCQGWQLVNFTSKPNEDFFKNVRKGVERNGK